MNPISVVTPLTRERIAREFDERGPTACVQEVLLDLKHNNPELLDIAGKWVTSLRNCQRVMMGFSMFYRLIMSPALPAGDDTLLHPLPRVSPEVRDRIVREIDEVGTESFIRAIIDDMERTNPELLQMTHGFASRQPEYLPVMQGFALVYKALTEQAAADRVRLQ